MAGRISLDVQDGVYGPDYSLTFYKNGDPRKRIRGVDLGSALSIQTSKSLNDISGTWSVTLKDGSVITPSGGKRRGRGIYTRNAIDQMDVCLIRLRGHDGNWHPVLHGVVDDVGQSGDASIDGGSDNTVIDGRCMAKYLQETSMFLPVWDPAALLPTALIFGLGAAANALYPNGGNMPRTPRAIFGALCDAFTYGKRNTVGESGIPNSRHWLNRKKRFETLDYVVPFIQFNEDSMANALKSLEILGFTEAWVDETGNVVYRHPQWDAPASYSISTGSLTAWSFTKADPQATYVEIVPGGSLLLDTAIQQALMSGRAPVPESYITSAKGKNDLGKYVSQQFVIDTDSKGKVTAKGRRNFWYRQQRQYGVRPMQITSPLIATQSQAQSQAEGLLQFYSRFQKTATITFPGQAGVRLGRTILIHGELDGVRLNRTYYIEGVQHSYTEGQGYTTTLTLTHGRDPGEPNWGKIVLPNASVNDVVSGGGVIDGASAPQGSDTPTITSSSGYALPLAKKYLRRAGDLGSTDDGVDIETAPDGAYVYSMTPGVVSTVAADHSQNGGFGPNYPVIQVTDGPLKGSYIYYGHVARSLVSKGDPVKAGDRIAVMGHTGDAASLGHGHIEIGFSDAGGNPLNHHGGGADRSTPQGTKMRNVLLDLIAA